MKLLTLITLSIALILAPLAGQAKEHNKSSQHVVVNGSQHNGHSTRSHNKHYSTKAHNGNSRKRHYSGGHNNHRSYKHYSHGYRSHNIASAIIVGAALNHAYGVHGSHHNGHAWCPIHHTYHTHSVSYSSHHYDYNNGPRKVESYIEEDEDRCFRVTEYSNGDERRKRIRNHHCDEIISDDWE
ncbi:MAG: hypothetical protein ACI9FJ_000834 [Alteromonadaceae bacterium]|jgi:hypothetical protein